MGSDAENKSDLLVAGLTGLGMVEDANPVHPEMQVLDKQNEREWLEGLRAIDQSHPGLEVWLAMG
jgi:hypothetical protein